MAKDVFEKLEELGYTTKRTKKISEIGNISIQVVCPLCGLHRPMRRTGRYAKMRMVHYIRTLRGRVDYERQFRAGERIKSRAREYNPTKETRFDAVDLKKGPFLSVRANLGRGKGFEEIAIVPLSYIHNLKETDRELIREHIIQIEEQCKKILEVIKKEKEKMGW